jgi:hypothetical protein
MLAASLDYCGEINILRFSITGNESESTWTSFLEFLHGHLTFMNDASATFVSDRDKGLKESISTVFSSAANLPCCQHLAENVKSYFGTDIAELFRAMTKTFDQNTFSRLSGKINLKSPAALAYINNIPKEIWSNAYIDKPRFGHTTSNVVE